MRSQDGGFGCRFRKEGGVRKIHLALILSVIVLFGYQNCQKLPERDIASGNQSDSIVTVNLVDESIQKVNFITTENTTVQQGLKAYTLVSQYSYSINYSTGEILKSSDANQATVKYCLPKNLLTELHDILESSSVCTISNVKPDGGVCAQVYSYGYVQITTNRDILDLGSSSDACGSKKVDFCSAPSADMLKGWFQSVKSQVAQLSCL